MDRVAARPAVSGYLIRAMLYHEELPRRQRQQFSAYYFRYVALGEGCGCAEQVLARRSSQGLFSGIVAAALQRWRSRGRARRREASRR